MDFSGNLRQKDCTWTESGLCSKTLRTTPGSELPILLSKKDWPKLAPRNWKPRNATQRHFWDTIPKIISITWLSNRCSSLYMPMWGASNFNILFWNKKIATIPFYIFIIEMVLMGPGPENDNWNEDSNKFISENKLIVFTNELPSPFFDSFLLLYQNTKSFDSSLKIFRIGPIIFLPDAFEDLPLFSVLVRSHHTSRDGKVCEDGCACTAAVARQRAPGQLSKVCGSIRMQSGNADESEEKVHNLGWQHWRRGTMMGRGDGWSRMVDTGYRCKIFYSIYISDWLVSYYEFLLDKMFLLHLKALKFLRALNSYYL